MGSHPLPPLSSVPYKHKIFHECKELINICDYVNACVICRVYSICSQDGWVYNVVFIGPYVVIVTDVRQEHNIADF